LEIFVEISESHGCNGNAGLVTKASDHVVETGVTKTKKCKEEHPVSQLQIDFLLAIASFFCRDFESERSPTRTSHLKTKSQTRKIMSRSRAKLDTGCHNLHPLSAHHFGHSWLPIV
jgi:hypothetical protein